MTHTRLKAAFLAAASLTAASIAAAPATAAAPTEPVAVEHILAAQSHEEERVSSILASKHLGFGAAALAALAGLVRLVGLRRLKTAAAATARAAGKAAAAGAQASLEAAKSVARAASSPLRFFLALAGLGLFALTGVGFYDVEWLGGLLVGAAMASLVLIGAAKTQKAFAFNRQRRRVND